jgi:hypothetical protein
MLMRMNQARRSVELDWRDRIHSLRSLWVFIKYIQLAELSVGAVDFLGVICFLGEPSMAVAIAYQIN